MPPEITGHSIRIQGIVQGVGLRPHIWQIAQQLKVTGWVKNDAEGVLINVWAEPSVMSEFINHLQRKPPPLASIQQITQTPISHSTSHTSVAPKDFSIITSDAGVVNTSASTDAATCPACLADIHNPNNRRYRYPFTNCTHCGPRFTILKRIPYDRDNTSMSSFALCSACEQEYNNPKDRRFHAQPNACPECGPRLWLEDRNGISQEKRENTDVIITTAELLKQGKIIAIKGIGGIHLACDATNEEAVATLRQRKRRHHKAFALMAKSCDHIRQFASLDEQQEFVLRSPAAPIVILQKKLDTLPESIAPQQSGLGFMLPYSPLHHLLMEEMETPIVLTSGNVSDEPQAISNQQARQQLKEIADYFLLHDRDIINRVDDSVVKVMAGEPRVLRRGRGLAPLQITLPEGFQQADGILAMGADLKNTFCIVKQGQAIISQYMGDLEEVHTQLEYRQQLNLYQALYQFSPHSIVIDKHPGYHSSQYGKELATNLFTDDEEASNTVIEVQHHHAHIASCMVEHEIPLHCNKVLGIALDGLGFGDDGSFWGGEFLLVDYTSSQRIGRFKPAPMLGGNQAMHEPWRNTLSQLLNTGRWPTLLDQYGDLSLFQFLKGKPLEILTTMADKNINSPRTTSAGRLFEAAAAILDICRDAQTFEGQAAMALEAAATKSPSSGKPFEHIYPYTLSTARTQQDQNTRTSTENLLEIDWSPMWLAILEELQNQTPICDIAASFHHTVAHAVCKMISGLHQQYNFDTVILSGGVMQNQLLVELMLPKIEQLGPKVLMPQNIPCNDSGISLGQAVIGFAK